jgi:putative two-component system response regulator
MSKSLEKKTILVVDDVPENIDVLNGILRTDYRVRVALNGEQALRIATSRDTPDLILLDIMMPGMDGYEVCRHLKASVVTRNVPVIFVTARGEVTDETRGFEVGGVDYITKPVSPPIVQARVKTHLRLRGYQLHLEELVREQVKEISDSQMTTIFALAKLAESRDDDTGQHLERVQAYCKALATRLSFLPRFEASIDGEFIKDIYQASALHDIGKVGIPDDILLKPARLTADEFEIIKTHTTIGAETLEAVRSRYPNNAFVNMGIAIARSHHEAWNGLGYPDGLAGEKIPLPARIMAFADVYDALRSRRPYKQAYSHERSCEIIATASGTQFDPHLFEVFMEIAQEFNEIREAMQDQR